MRSRAASRVAALEPAGARVTYLRGWERSRWWNSPMFFWDDFSADGELGPESKDPGPVGALSLGTHDRAGRRTPTSRSCWRGTSRIARRGAAAGARRAARKTR